ncbi:DEAD/DEAH box helicase [Paracoccaceae bacterium]|nr:DEAD/DEAH box helicase [Paracoccaceae bacterium]
MIQTLSDALAQQGYDTLTPVQEAVSDPALETTDLLVSAQTGSGKTVGFGLAIAPNLLTDSLQFTSAGAPLALVIAPTRELALQVKRELAWLYAKAGAVLASCVGGMDMRDERRALARGAHIVVATPGRLRDHIQRGSLDMTALRAVVLDEADEMLDLGFREDLEFILGESPENRRTLMFSATVPRAIATLAQHYQKQAVRIATASETSQHSDIEYRALSVAMRDTENAIINVLRYYEAPNAIVFCNTRAMVNRLTTRFSNRGFSVVALSGELTQNERTHALQSMRDGRARVCVATDVAARGIDLPNLELVIHAELPTNFETLLHRSGRTGRAGRKGVSTLIVPAKSRNKAQRLLKMAKVTAEWAAPPSADEVTERDQVRLLDDPTWQEPVADNERDFVQKLTELYSADQIAAAYMRLYAGRTSAPEDLDPAPQEEARKPRAAFGASIWFAVSQGRADGAEPRRLLPMVCNAGNITKDDIGAIRIQQSESFVEIRQESAAAFEAAVGPGGKLEDNIRLRKLDKAPDLSQSPREPRADYKVKKPSSGPRSASSPRPQSSSRPQPSSRPKPGSKPESKLRDARPDFSENRKPRNVKTDRSKPDPRPERTRPEGVVEPRKPKKSAGAKPQPAHKKAAYSNDKPKAAPKDGPKPGGYKDKGGDRPKSKSEPRPKGKEGGFSKPRSASGATGKSNKRSGAAAVPSGGGDAAKRYRAAANDTSKRFVPPGGKASARPPRAESGKGAGKLRVSKGPNAVPRRSK